MGQWRIFLRSLFAKRVLPGPYQGATECLSTALVPAGGAFCCFVLPVQCPQLDNVTCAGRQPWQAMGHQAPLSRQQFRGMDLCRAGFPAD